MRGTPDKLSRLCILPLHHSCIISLTKSLARTHSCGLDVSLVSFQARSALGMLTSMFMINDQNSQNICPCNGFVKRSATIFTTKQFLISISPDFTLSKMKNTEHSHVRFFCFKIAFHLSPIKWHLGCLCIPLCPITTIKTQ